MRKIRLALALGEEEYGKRMVAVLMNHYRKQLEIHMYLQDLSWMNQLIGLKSDNIDLEYDLLICADLTEDKLKEAPWERLGGILPVIYLKDGEEEEEIVSKLTFLLGEDGVIFVEKYQEMSKIMDEILKLAGKDVKAVYEGNEIQVKTPFLGVYSLAENQYQLPFAMTLGSILGESQRVLLLDLQENSGITQMINETTAMGLETLLSACEEEQITKARIVSCIGHLGKLDIVYPAENSECLCEIGAKQYLKILELLRQELDYDVILMNFGSRFQGFFEVINRCKNLYLIEGKGGLAKWRENEFIEELVKRGYQGFENKIEYVDIPITTIGNSCERIVEQWKWNELGDSIRRMSSQI